VADGAWPACVNHRRRRRAGGPRRCPSGCAPGGSPGTSPRSPPSPNQAIAVAWAADERAPYRPAGPPSERRSSAPNSWAHGRAHRRALATEAPPTEGRARCGASKNRTCDLSIIRAGRASGSLDRVNESGSNLGCPRWSGWPRLRETDRRLRPPSRHRSGQRSGVRGCPELTRPCAPEPPSTTPSASKWLAADKARGGDPAVARASHREKLRILPGTPRTQKEFNGTAQGSRRFCRKGTCVPVREEEPESHGETVVLVSVLVRPQSRREDTQTPSGRCETFALLASRSSDKLWCRKGH